MSDQSAVTPPVTDVALHDALNTALDRHFGGTRAITGIERRQSGAASSFTLEELDVTLDDGTRLPMLFKDVGCAAQVRRGNWHKPAFLCQPLREIETYRHILAHAGLSTATCYGAISEPWRDRYWLFLERVAGLELYQAGFETWVQVARWLAGMHARFFEAAEMRTWSQAVPLLHYDAGFYRHWLSRARANLRQTRVGEAQAQEQIDWLAQRYEAIVEQLHALPLTLIHGEFYAANVLVADEAHGLRVCPVDWEMTAIGPGLIDLAALTAGSWTEQERETLARAYFEAALPGLVPSEPGQFRQALDCCRLHLAVQWLGWSTTPTRAPHVGPDWLQEAVRLAPGAGV